ncbi:MAG: phosphoribosylformylglycinamidine synthase subunit PurS [Planctomycetota bacterium]
MSTTASVTSGTGVIRVEVFPREGERDPRAETLLREARSIGVAAEAARVTRVYLIEAALAPDLSERIAQDLLADPVRESFEIGARTVEADAALVEVHPLPGVMDPAGQSVADAVRDLFLDGRDCSVSTGWRYELLGVDGEAAERVARRLLANPVVNAIRTEPFHPGSLPHGTKTGFELKHIPIRGLDDAALERMSRDAHLFLSLDEMREIRGEYETLGREPTDIELETLAQTWSEHCVHKTLKSNVRYTGSGIDGIDWSGREGVTIEADGSVTIDNLLKRTVAAATFELIDEGIDWTLSVFVDNAGVVKLTDDWAVNVKVETHNHPSALEPYGGAATGIGGCIRDVIGTGLGAKPIASTDVFCVAPPGRFTVEEIESGSRNGTEPLPTGCLRPERILNQIVSGVRDYGNRMGIPTVNGAVWFDERYVGNPLVYCGCVGLMPADKISGAARPGDKIVAIGGRTGRDGIHGATFSSAELTDSHADEFSHAVQIGNAIEEKRLLDAILRARDVDGGPLFSAITDCGAGGFSSAVGEMGEKVGATVELDAAPLKYAGLSYTEIWISEAQERMVLAVPEENLAELREICEEEHSELSVLGTFGLEGEHGPELLLNYHGTEVGRLPMSFLHDGIPMPTREASWETPETNSGDAPSHVEGGIEDTLHKLLSHPNIASKHWIVRQYDHEVQGRTVTKPLVGPGGRGPGDAAVMEPLPGSDIGLAIGCGLATGLEADPYVMALCAIDECVRNLVCVGADPERVAILDNFCWPSCKKPENMGSLVRACMGCYDGAKAYRTPFVSGKDSLNNQFTTEEGITIEIPPTLLITGIGRVNSLAHAITMDAKTAGNAIVLIEPTGDKANSARSAIGGSHYASLRSLDGPLPGIDVQACARTARWVAARIASGSVVSAHDVSDGGLIAAIAEMLIGGSSSERPIGLQVTSPRPEGFTDASWWFGERPGCYVLEMPAEAAARLVSGSASTDAVVTMLGMLDGSGSLRVSGTDAMRVEDLANSWLSPLDW